MTSANVEIVRRLFEAIQAAWSSADPDALVGSVAADFEVIPAAELPWGKTYGGREGLLDFMQTWAVEFADWSFEVERLVAAADDRVVGFIHQWGTGKASGARVDQQFGALAELQDGRVVRVRFYLHPAQALEAASVQD